MKVNVDITTNTQRTKSLLGLTVIDFIQNSSLEFLVSKENLKSLAMQMILHHCSLYWRALTSNIFEEIAGSIDK
jgi:hypothetical protein